MLVLISDFAIRYGLGYNLGAAPLLNFSSAKKYNLGNGKLCNFGFVGKQTSESLNLCLYLACF